LTTPAKNLVFDSAGFEDLSWWIEKDRKKALRIIKLIKEIQRDPFHGTGKPEPLKHELSGCWSRRIDQEHRLVYEVKKDTIRILACRYHY
jgi:toxin YoeB